MLAVSYLFYSFFFCALIPFLSATLSHRQMFIFRQKWRERKNSIFNSSRWEANTRKIAQYLGFEQILVIRLIAAFERAKSSSMSKRFVAHDMSTSHFYPHRTYVKQFSTNSHCEGYSNPLERHWLSFSVRDVQICAEFDNGIEVAIGRPNTWCQLRFLLIANSLESFGQIELRLFMTKNQSWLYLW